MNPVVERVLESGLIDKTVVMMMEKSGALPEGSSDKVKEELLNASRAVLREFADGLYGLITTEHEKEAQLRETVLDLRTLRWPVDLSLQQWFDGTTGSGSFKLIKHLKAMVDSSGKYYIRIQDASLDDLMVGHHFVRYVDLASSTEVVREVIDEVREMYLGDQRVCYLVSTHQAEKK